MVLGLVEVARSAKVVMKALNQRPRWHRKARWLVLYCYPQGVDIVQLEQVKSL